MIYINVNAVQVLIALGYTKYEAVVRADGSGILVHKWNEADTQPTDQQITDWATDAAALPSGPLFSVWLAEHGGDVLLTLRRIAKEALSNNRVESNALIRAVVLELLDYSNAQRAEHNTLLAWLGTQTTLTNLGQLTAMQLNEATPVQARNAIKARLTNGEAD